MVKLIPLTHQILLAERPSLARSFKVQN